MPPRSARDAGPWGRRDSRERSTNTSSARSPAVCICGSSPAIPRRARPGPLRTVAPTYSRIFFALFAPFARKITSRKSGALLARRSCQSPYCLGAVIGGVERLNAPSRETLHDYLRRVAEVIVSAGTEGDGEGPSGID